MTKLNIGCGNNILDGYINIDIRDIQPKRVFGNAKCIEPVKDDHITYLLHEFYGRFPSIYTLRKDNYTNNTIELLYPGLGDAVIMTSLPKLADASWRKLKIFSTNNNYLSELLKFNEYHDITEQYDSEDIIQNSEFPLHNWGGGHPIQLMEKALGLLPQVKPKGYINKKITKIKNKIGIGIEPQKVSIQRALSINELYIIQQFIDFNLDKYYFVEIGTEQSRFENTTHVQNLSTSELIDELGSCEYFIGTASGLMNLAAALDVKSVILANVPDANLFYLPCLVAGNGIPELSWMYPQNVHLHLDGENELVKRFSYDNLSKALAGEIYPYWEETYLPLVFEYDNITINRMLNSFEIGDVENLQYPENSIDEIQAIDIFEHISYLKSKQVLKHWVSLLKPGGVIYIQAPSITKILNYLINAKTISDVEQVIALLFGGQDYPENYHKTVCDPVLLTQYLREAGIGGSIEFQDLGANLKVRAFK